MGEPATLAISRPSAGGTFSGREAQIVELIALGCEDKEIASRLGISRRTVRTHLERLFGDLGVHSRAAAVAIWMSQRV
ncbi:MAG TPA: helix-turn-helix transcriptional regulator [Candidatus Limnocylindria bacterium]|jgi:DNA-binding NarL/FixJ family response regulator|nr:helix-turn-helix transcriptional regulator [Candidatus Limnocylindria bacterium]